MKLIKYELYKLCTKKIIFFVVFILFCLNSYLFYSNQRSVIFTNSKEYKTLESKYIHMDTNIAYDELEQLTKYFGFVQMILFQREQGIDEKIIKNQTESRLEQLSESISYEEFLERYVPNFDDIEEFKSIDEAIYFLMNQLRHINSYPDFILSMREKADKMERVSVFQQKNTFAHRNIIKTISDFDDLKEINLSLGQEEGVLAFSQFKFTDYFLLAIILLMGIYLFVDERENGILNLIKPTKNGRLQLAFSKLTVFIFVVVILGILFYGTNYILAKNMFGYGDTSRWIQSMSSFRDASIPMSLNQYFFFFGMIKFISLIFFTLLVSLIFIVVNNTRISYSLIGFILAISYLAYEFIYPISYINVCKYLNIFAFLDGHHLIANYVNLNIFGYPISRVTTTIVVLVLAIMVCYIFYLICFSNNFSHTINIRIRMLKGKRKVNLKSGSVNLFYQEVFKNFISNKILYLILLSLLIGYSNLNLKEIFFTFDQAIYNSYSMDLTGAINSEKTSHIEEEQFKFNDLSNQIELLNQQLEKKEITKEDFDMESLNLYNFASRGYGFNIVKEQYESLLRLQEERGIHGHFISKISSDYIFNLPKRDLLIGLIYSILLTLCLSNVFCCEYNKGMIHIIRSTRNGRGKLFFIKSFIGYISSLLLMAALYLPLYITLIFRYKFNDWIAPIQSIQQFRNIQMNINILGFITGVMVIQLITGFVMSAVLILLSQVVKKQNLIILLGFILFSVPFIFSFISPKMIQKAFFVGGFNSYYLLTDVKSITHIVLFFIIILILGLGSNIVAYKKFCNR